MPDFFTEMLNNICEHCKCKNDILWRNFCRSEQHFDTCFRYFEEKESEHKRCFLKRESLSGKTLETESLLTPDSTCSQRSFTYEAEVDLFNGPSH
jgi:hypothetical protein